MIYDPSYLQNFRIHNLLANQTVIDPQMFVLRKLAYSNVTLHEQTLLPFSLYILTGQTSNSRTQIKVPRKHTKSIKIMRTSNSFQPLQMPYIRLT